MLAKFKSQERKVHQTNDCDICKVQAKKLSTQIHNADKDLGYAHHMFWRFLNLRVYDFFFVIFFVFLQGRSFLKRRPVHCVTICATMMSWVGCLLKDSELFILVAENSQILLKISVIPIILTFIYLVALILLVNNQLNSLSNSTHHCGT